MRRVLHRLTVRQVETVSKPGLIADGRGLARRGQAGRGEAARG